MADHTYDLVLFGATGFTGELTADYLARHAPAGCRWALAGRSQSKLAAVRSRLAGIDADLAELPLLLADVNNAESLRAVAEASRVVIRPSARTSCTASRWWQRARRPAPTTSTSPVSRSSSI